MNEQFSKEERNIVRKIFEEMGETEAVKHFGVSTESLLRVLADLPVRKGTAMVVREGIRKAAMHKQ